MILNRHIQSQKAGNTDLASKHWLQSNLNLLANIFGRGIVGIHNPTFVPDPLLI